jgi:hypothetical protein
MTKQAYNVKARGGKIMLLVSDDRSFKDHYNVDDQIGDRVNIATVIIKKDEGEEIRNFLYQNTHEHVVMSIKFTSKFAEFLTLDLFLRSDELKSLNFFIEFKQYYDKISKIKCLFS